MQSYNGIINTALICKNYKLLIDIHNVTAL